MLRLFAVLALMTFSLPASGPYSPTRIDPRRDQLYDQGKAVYWGDVKVGAGSTCGECHVKHKSLSRKNLEKVKFNLETRVNECVHSATRVDGNLQDEQMKALLHYLAKRYGL